MPTADQYEDHTWCMENLKKSQDADSDMREHVREAHNFVDARDGQWESSWWDQSDGKPRYTFDVVNPIIDQVVGTFENRDFSVRVAPAGNEASEDTAETYDGLIRNIENISKTDDIYERISLEMITSGLDGAEVVQEYVDGDSFDQDLVVKHVGNFVDRVWFGPHEEPDASDSRYAWKLSGIEKDLFEEKYPDATQSSVSQDRDSNTYYFKHDLIMVGKFYYLKAVERELVLMSSGKVYDTDQLAEVADELEQLGITEVRRRKRTKLVVMTRMFSANEWLGKPQETVFEGWIPLVPAYGNFKYFEDKPVYYGVVEKVLDPQRVLNYSMSREIEEGALAPRAKYWMTEAQAAGHEDTLATLNTNSDPVQFYNPDTEAPGVPQQSGGAAINPGLRTISEAMQQVIGHSAGMFAANMGDNPGLQSGVAIDSLQDRGDVGGNKYIRAMERFQGHIGKILVKAIPKIYEPKRQVRVLGEDGSMEMVVLGETVIDEQTGQEVVLHDLNQGLYDVTCTSGPSFKNRQSQTVNALTEIGKVDPSVIELGGDILMGNITSPGMDKIAERKRMQLFNAGLIPPEQLTDEEKAMQAQMAQQPQEESPEMVLARGEEAKGQADLIDAQTKQVQVQSEAQYKQEQVKIDAFNAETARFKAQTDYMLAQVEMKGTAASAAKSLSEAEAQDLENDAVQAGIFDLVKEVSGMSSG